MKKFNELKATSTQRLRSLGLFILNPKKGTFLNRTPSSWAKIFIYYVIFYTCLFGFLISLIFFVTNVVIDKKVPSLTGRQSLLGLSPGLTFLPVADYKGSLSPHPVYDSDHKAKYVEFMRKYLSNYQAGPSNCDFFNGTRQSGSLYDACYFPLSILGPCNPNQGQGGEFCVYMKMNKIFGYIPDVSGTRIYVSCQPTVGFLLRVCPSTSFFSQSCVTFKDESKSRELGQIAFFPNALYENQAVGYFSTVAFPYLNQADYQSPLLAITFPYIAKNVPITVGCKYLNGNVNEVYKFELIVRGSP
ncbi:Sodium/potassium-transporting ATPase subunit beta-2 [Taenia solium]|eukprot:TsM_000237200 transcript=TsM_000237200 gene=TsM_000237200